MKNLVLSIVILFSGFAVGARGETLHLSLAEAISRARCQSVDADVALNELRASWWEYRSYRADLLPELSFSGSVPSYHREYATYMNEKGEYSFVGNNYLQINGGLSLSQNIWLTGGTISLNTSIDFLRQLSGEKYNRFMSVPIALTLSQPVFGVNDIKWQRRIEPTRFREAQAAFLSATEDVAISAIGLYFTVLMERANFEIADQNLQNASRLLEVAREKRDMGRISKNDLRQMELNLLDAESSRTSAISNLRNASFNLMSFLDIGGDVEIELEIPDFIPTAEVTYEAALQKALDNNKFAHNQLRRQLEADYEVAKAKGDMRKINLFAQVGFTGTSHRFDAAYQDLHDNQLVEIGFEIPIVDWGKRRGKVKVAESNRDLTRNRLRQEAQEFSQNLFTLVERFSNQRRQLQIASQADTISAERYATNFETFLSGRISTLDLNDSQSQKDEARRQYITQLYYCWLYYYQLRSLTLWDFESSTPIDADFAEIMK